MTIIFLTVGGLIIVTMIALYFFNKRQEKKLRKNYTDALFGNDIQKAIAAGRAYYRKRNHALTSAAEKAIQRDLAKNGFSNTQVSPS